MTAQATRKTKATKAQADMVLNLMMAGLVKAKKAKVKKAK